MSEEEWEILYSNLQKAFQQIKETKIAPPENPNGEIEPLSPYLTEKPSFSIIQEKPKPKPEILGQPKRPEEQAKILQAARQKLPTGEVELLATALSARTLPERKAAAAQLSKAALKSLSSMLLADYASIPDNAWYQTELAALELLNLGEDSFRQSFHSSRPLTLQELRNLFTRFVGETADIGAKMGFLKESDYADTPILTRQELAYIGRRYVDQTFKPIKATFEMLVTSVLFCYNIFTADGESASCRTELDKNTKKLWES